MAVDPVCKMNVVEKKAAATYEYKGKTYYFCAVGCKQAFAKDPEKYLNKQIEEIEHIWILFWVLLNFGFTVWFTVFSINGLFNLFFLNLISPLLTARDESEI